MLNNWFERREQYRKAGQTYKLRRRVRSQVKTESKVKTEKGELNDLKSSKKYLLVQFSKIHYEDGLFGEKMH